MKVKTKIITLECNEINLDIVLKKILNSLKQNEVVLRWGIISAQDNVYNIELAIFPEEDG